MIITFNTIYYNDMLKLKKIINILKKKIYIYILKKYSIYNNEK